jgi:septum formation protein
MKHEFILASSSPRRKALLKQVGLDFKIVPSRYEEDMGLKLDNVKLAKTLAYGKAKEVASRIKKGVIIGSDTFVSFRGERIGKPKNIKDAERILRMISGKKLKIYSGLAIIDKYSGKEIVDYEMTEVKIKKMTQDEIKKYIKTGEPLDKAGAFGIQEQGVKFVEKINGCYSNVVGLPIYKLYVNLQKIGINI